MAITEDLRKTLSDPTPFYFAAGTADLALQQAKKVPGLVEQLRAEAPARIEAVRHADPKAVQEKATARVKETQEKAAVRAKEAQETLQTKVTEIIGTLDTDLKKLGETAQDLALRGVGVAAEYAVKARETYEKVAEHGEQAVKNWRGEAAEEIEELAVAVEPNAEPGEIRFTEEEKPAAATVTPVASAKKPAAKKAPAKKTTPAAKKTTPPAK
jgi:heparin binding hemagglutinin HbhA